MEWPTDWSLLGTLVATGLLYWRGSRRPSLRALPPGQRRRRAERLWQPLTFYAALATILVALASLDRLSEQLFSVHMVQHMLLMLVAAPLLVLAAPWTALWRPFPLAFRRAVAGTVTRSRVCAPLRGLAHWIALPIPAWLLFNVDIGVWHVPAAYDLTVRNPTVHYLEHLSFIGFGILFWAQLIDSPPFRARLDYFGRSLYAAAGAAATWILAVVLAIAPTPLYSAYAELAHRPGGLSALTDQQLAAGAMWGPGSIPYGILVFWALYRWLGPEDAPARRRRRGSRRVPAGQSSV
jgi:cytochrome c oxidase assembly factor CtaG